MGEGEFVRDVPYRRVCVPCRRVLSGKSAGVKRWRDRRLDPGLDISPLRCPECGGPLVAIGHHVEVPPRRKVKAWAKMTAGWRLP